MANTKREAPLITPPGIAVYPHLNKADSKFNEDKPKYHCKLRFNPTTDPRWAEFVDKLRTALAEKLAAQKAKPENAKIAKLPWKAKYEAIREVTDDDGNLTGELEIIAKMNASYTDKKSGKAVAMKPGICDSKGNELKNPPAIWGGSKLKLAIRPGVQNTGKEYTEFLQLSGVQIIQLVTGTGGNVGSMFGADEEGGFEGEEDNDGFGDESSEAGAAGGAASGADGDEDF
jgi:hypothetical protein